MRSMNIALLKRLCEAPGIPGHEDAIRKVVIEEMRGLVDEISVDPMGNVIGVRKGSGGPKVAVSAHMDEIGFIVKHIEEDGYLRIHPVGGFDPRVLVAQRVHVHGFAGETLLGAVQPASKPIHLLEGELKPAKIEELVVDVGLTGDEVRKRVEIGDMVTLARTFETLGDTSVMSKSLDDRVSVFTMLEALRGLQGQAAEIVAIASTQEEVGLRGARTAAFSVQADINVALDITLALDTPGMPADSAVTRLGKGVAIKLMDSSHISHPKLVRHMRDICESKGIPHQFEILPRGGTDAGAMQLAGKSNAAITLSIPTRYVHTVNEMARITDIQATIDLLAAYLQVAGSRSYGYEV